MTLIGRPCAITRSVAATCDGTHEARSADAAVTNEAMASSHGNSACTPQARPPQSLGEPDLVAANDPLPGLHRADRAPECRQGRAGQSGAAEQQEVALQMILSFLAVSHAPDISPVVAAPQDSTEVEQWAVDAVVGEHHLFELRQRAKCHQPVFVGGKIVADIPPVQHQGRMRQHAAECVGWQAWRIRDEDDREARLTECDQIVQHDVVHAPVPIEMGKDGDLAALDKHLAALMACADEVASGAEESGSELSLHREP